MNMGVRVEIPVNLGRSEVITTIDEDDLYSQKYAIIVLSTVMECSATMLCDADLRRKVHEYRELLEFAHRKPNERPHHPSMEWVCDSPCNYDWLYEVLSNAYDEYQSRFGLLLSTLKPLTPVHMMHPFDNQLGNYMHANPPPLCVPEEYRVYSHSSRWENAVETYRQYYIHEMYDARWSATNAPDWFTTGVRNFEADLASADIRPVRVTKVQRDKFGQLLVNNFVNGSIA
jgi:hypothetical protein